MRTASEDCFVITDRDGNVITTLRPACGATLDEVRAICAARGLTLTRVPLLDGETDAELRVQLATMLAKGDA